ncbi:MAG TPA: 50S ribosomal protein L11 methyltransferase [Fimbriimonadaceae bacterium]|nr:50S ribosomal protein L11 methyltransferase [Fimbriimonadaceae bacterium]
MKRWIEIEAQLNEPPEDWSPFADAFTRYGCDASVIGNDDRTISGYFEEVEGAQAYAVELKNELARLGAANVRIGEVPDQDWSEVWKAHFKPHRIGAHFVVVPSWESFEPGADDIILLLDPGQAFGTGEHPTTRLCLRLMEPIGVEGKTVLDLGCGSGILAIAAAKLGAASVTATDIEPLAVEIARENALRNETDIELFGGNGFGDWAAGRTWDLVLSNIISATLFRLADKASQYVAPGGTWIISGVLEQNFADVRSAIESAGFTFVQAQSEDDWVGAEFRRTEP